MRVLISSPSMSWGSQRSCVISCILRVSRALLLTPSASAMASGSAIRCGRSICSDRATCTLTVPFSSGSSDMRTLSTIGLSTYSTSDRELHQVWECARIGSTVQGVVFGFSAEFPPGLAGANAR
jgi:hypothetical protein